MSLLSRISGRVCSCSLIRPKLSADFRSPQLVKYCSSLSSQLGNTSTNKNNLIDTVTWVKILEAEGFPVNQSEAIIASITEVFHSSIKHVESSCMLKSRMDHFKIVKRSTLRDFKYEMRNTQENIFTSLEHNIEKAQEDIEKIEARLTAVLDQEIPALRALIENARFGIIKYFVGSLAAVVVASFATCWINKKE